MKTDLDLYERMARRSGKSVMFTRMVTFALMQGKTVPGKDGGVHFCKVIPIRRKKDEHST